MLHTFANAIIVQWGWRRALIAFGAGAVSALAFAPFYAFPLLWLTVPVLVWLIDGAEPAHGARWPARLLPAAIVGFFFGFGFFVAGLWWIGTALLVEADQFAWALPIAVIALPAVLALFWAFGAALARAFWLDGWLRIVAFAIAMTLAEWLRGHLFTGFPWNVFGYALTPFPVMMQSASVVGIWGITLAAFLVFAAPAVLADGRRPARGAQVLLAAAVGLLALHVAFGIVRLSHGDDPVVPGVSIRVIQPMIPQEVGYNIEAADEVMARYLELSRRAPAGPPGLDGVTILVWPESAFPFLLTERPSALSAIADLLPEGTSLITGAARADPSTPPGTPRRIFNSAYVIDDRGEIRGAYDKVHLVPFGEYIPFRDMLGAIGLRQLIDLPGGFSPGVMARTLEVAGAPAFGPLICYEVIFPGEVVSVDSRPSWLLNLTNDGWYGSTPGPHQHFLQARVRAVEEGLPLVRAANTGISAIVDAHGRITTTLDLGTIGTLDGNLPQDLTWTPFGMAGNLIFWGLMGFACAIFAAGGIYRRL